MVDKDVEAEEVETDSEEVDDTMLKEEYTNIKIKS